VSNVGVAGTGYFDISSAYAVCQFWGQIDDTTFATPTRTTKTKQVFGGCSTFT
jgi:hypothetical protein